MYLHRLHHIGFFCAFYSHFPKSSLCPWVPSVKDIALPLSPLIPYFLSFPFIHPSFPPSATPTPTTPNMCYSDIAARTRCFSMPRDRQSITAWLSLSIGSEPPLAQPLELVWAFWLVTRGLGLVSACPLVDLLDWSQLIQRWTLGGLLGLSNISIKAKCMLQQTGARAPLNGAVPALRLLQIYCMSLI